MTTTPRNISQPNYHRSGRIASGGNDVAKYHVLQFGSGVDEVALATAVTDKIAGVCVEDMTAGGPTKSYQVDGKVPVYSGGAISVGDELTVDASGRVITASQSASSTQNLVGYAVTAASGAAELVEVELGRAVTAFVGSSSVATKAALKAITAANRFNGQQIHVEADRSNWVFDDDAAQTEDTAQELVLAPDAGTGRWLRADRAFMMRIPIGSANTDGEAIETIPEGFCLRLTGHGYWEVTTAWTGGSSSAIGISSNITGYETGGDLLGGASGDVLATLTAGIKAGTQGGELDDEVAFHALFFIEGSEFQFDRITSAFTAGAGFACFPVVQAVAPATP